MNTRSRHKGKVLFRSEMGPQRISPADDAPAVGSTDFFTLMAVRLHEVAAWLKTPGAEEVLENNAEVRELVMRVVADAQRLDKLVRFGTADRVGAKYGLSADAFWQIVYDQNWCCPICQRLFTPDGPRFNVDHNHATGEVRGILCSSCNSGLGLLRDSPALLDRALAYLEERGCYGPNALGQESE